MLDSAPLAHAEHADLTMLDRKRLVSKFATVDRRSSLRRLELASLNEHASNHSVDLATRVVQRLSIGLLEPLAELQEIGNCARSNLVEQLENHLHGFARPCEYNERKL